MPRMDRVPHEDRKDELMAFRVSKAEKALWQREAERQDVPLSRLIRYVVTQYCEQRQKKSGK